MSVYDKKRILKESIPLLATLVLIEILAGQMLNASKGIITVPILLALIPVINGIGGNIGSILGARLASGLHAGHISISFREKKLHKNVLQVFILGLITYTFLAMLLYYIIPYFGIGVNGITLMEIGIVMIGSGLILIILLVIICVITAFISFKRGIDPDNTVTPVVTTCGDFFGISCLILMVNLVIL